MNEKQNRWMNERRWIDERMKDGKMDERWKKNG